MRQIVKRLLGKGQKIACYMDSFWAEESGMGVVEIILIIVVLIGLVIIFKKQITGVVNDIISAVEKDAKSVYK
jgi:Flp pilus assembly pilin Flp